MFRQKCFFFKNNVAADVKRYWPFLPEMEDLVFLNGNDIWLFRVYRLSLKPHQTVNNRLDGAMPETGQRQRTVKRYLDMRNP